MSVTATIRIQQADFDVAQEIAALSKGRTDVGAVVTFSGICRGSENGEPIAALTLEHYPGMAEAEIGRHADEALSRWPLQGLTIIHRFGRIAPGENIVLVVTASSHRQAAFEAAEFLMDYLKTLLNAKPARPRTVPNQGLENFHGAKVSSAPVAWMSPSTPNTHDPFCQL